MRITKIIELSNVSSGSQALELRSLFAKVEENAVAEKQDLDEVFYQNYNKRGVVVEQVLYKESAIRYARKFELRKLEKTLESLDFEYINYVQS